MKQLLCGILVSAAFMPAVSFGAPDASALEGKWLTKKVSDEGQAYVQILEIKKNKFKFQVGESETEGRLFAEGDLKLEKVGPFDCAKFTNIRGGTSPSDLVDVDDEYVCIYVLDGDTWRVAANFDKEREQKPSMDLYKKVKQAATAGGSTLVIDEVEMASTPQSATWYFCLEATAGGTTKRFYEKDKGYEKNKVTIPVGLKIPAAKAGEKCSFKMQLDDIDEDVCTDEVDDRSTGEFTISDKGSQTFKPEDSWTYTIRWHLIKD